MKRAIVIIVSLCMLGVVAYGTFFAHSPVSNNPEEEEYYYNEKEWEKLEGMAEYRRTTVAEMKNRGIDTAPDSVVVLINKEFALPEDYVPENLVVPQVTFSFTGYKEKKLLRADAAVALEELFAAAQRKGLALFAVSGYRSYHRQKAIYESNVEKNGAERTNQFSAKPGYSEHQSGLAMDVSTNSIHNRLDESFAATPEGKFLESDAYRYGFIIRYPQGKSDITGYAYEPWHLRYVGKELAQTLYSQGITLEEYYNYIPSKALQRDDTYGTAIDVEELEEEY